MTLVYHSQTNLTERVNHTLKTMVAAYIGKQRKQWNKYLPEFRFAINSAVQVSTGVSPAELNLGCPLRGPLDVLVQPRETTPNVPAYSKVAQLEELSSLVTKNLDAARRHQKRNYNKNRQDMEFADQDRVWMQAHSLPKASKSFAAKLAPKWQGPYRVQQVNHSTTRLS